MKLLYISVLFLSLLVLFSHCKKDENSNQIVIEGQVKDVLTGEVAVGVSVQFFIQGIVDGVFNNNFQFIREDQTNSNGVFRIEFDKGTPTTYRFVVSGNGYYSLAQDENPDEFSADGINDQDLLINSRAWLKVRVVNEGNVNNGDQVTFGLVTENNGCLDCCSSGIVELSGGIDDTEICELFGGSYAHVNGVALDANFGPMDIHDSILVMPFDTTMMTISF